MLLYYLSFSFGYRVDFFVDFQVILSDFYMRFRGVFRLLLGIRGRG